jgi:molybdopterin-guanine dinucleotide biosynthesis protein A
MIRDVSIAILAGGMSKRLGTDKALVRLTEEDLPLLGLVIECVRPISDDVFVVSSPRVEYEQFGVAIRPDLYPDTGVLGGIASALRHARHDACLVVSCDHPFLNRALLEEMISAPGEWDVLVPVLPGESRQGGRTVKQTLHAIYGKPCLPAIEQKLGEGRLQIVGFFDEVRVAEIELNAILALDPDLRSFFSVNTPEALEIARRWRMEERNWTR